LDNICHTLVGAALAEAGLKKRTAFGSATLMIAANFPDIDVVAVPLGHSLGFRRGITHGIPALIVLPFVLTGIMLAWYQWRRRGEPPSGGWLLALSAIGIVTHPILDWMNTYGMRWLAPIDPSWSYGDTLFIVDPWIWLTLGFGVWLSRRRARQEDAAWFRPARVALAVVGVYIVAMMGLSFSSQEAVRTALSARGLAPDTTVVEPVPVNPFRRRVIYLSDGAYRLSTFEVLTRTLSAPWFEIPVNAVHPAVASANQTAAGREYHSWARLPYYVIEEAAETTWVTIADARYTLDGRSSWAVTRIPVTGDGATVSRCRAATAAGSSTCE
jgi:inner membrane protein